MSAPLPRATAQGLAGCHTCGKVSPVALGSCPRCGSRLHLRKPESITRTVATKQAMLISNGAHTSTPMRSAVANSHGHRIDEDGLDTSPRFTPKCPRARFSARAM